TTAIGFLGFLISPVAAIRQFGLTLSAGAIVALVVTLTLDAALLVLFWRPRKQGQTSIRTATETPDGVANGTRHFRRRLPLPPIEGAPDPSRPIPPRRASLIERWLLGQTTVAELRYRSRLALAIGAVLAAAGLASLTQLEIEDTWIRNFDPQSPVARDTERFEEEFLGTNVLAVVIAADPAVPGARARALDQINRLSTSLTVAPGLRGVLSATLLARSLDPRQGQPWRKWPTPSVARMREDRVTWNRRGLVLPRMRTLADSDLNRFQVLVFVLNQRYRDLLRRAGITAALAEEPAGAGVRVRVGGNLALNLRMVRLAVSAQAYSLIAVLAAIALLVVGFTRSLSSGMALLLPMVLAILMTFFILVGLGLPYGIAVSMFPTLVVGLALDFAIHLRAALVRNRSASRTRWARNLAVTVRGIVFNGAVWSAGFAVLIVSDLPPNRYLGLLCSVVVGLSTAATLLMLPAIALRIGRSPTSLA
ncbi:MAG: MMPL family transporter, partial [bacterium]|nr:MMPL family transporter [bacterium]